MIIRFARPVGIFAALTLLLAAGPALAQTRSVETTFGTVDVPENPVRIVTTHYIATQPLVDLGILPIGQGGADPSYVIPAHWEVLKDVPVVLQGAEPNYEMIAGLEPDLIFEINAASEDRVNRLRQIAPVVLVGVSGPDRALWQKRMHQIADAVNALDKVEALEATFAARQDAIAETYKDVIAEYPAAIVGSWAYDQGSARLFTANSMVGRVIAPTGTVFAPSAEALANADGSDVTLSMELVGTALADAAVVFYNNEASGADNASATAMRESDVYRLVPAIAAGVEYPIGQITIGGYGDANATLDWYEKALADLAE